MQSTAFQADSALQSIGETKACSITVNNKWECDYALSNIKYSNMQYGVAGLCCEAAARDFGLFKIIIIHLQSLSSLESLTFR